MEDYLDEDPPIKSQQFVCISLFIPGKEDECDDHDSRCGIKIRGSYATMDQAEKRVEELKAIDKLHHIYVGEVGKWLPFNPRPEESGKEIYPTLVGLRSHRSQNKFLSDCCGRCARQGARARTCSASQTGK